MSRVLLLNPPGSHNYIRDYFCSKRAKTNYQFPPSTLLFLSGWLAETHDVMVLDATAEALTVEQSLARIRATRPEAVVSLVGAACWDEDRAFLAQVKAATDAYLIGIGDLLLEDTEARLEEAPGLDAALLSFATRDVLSLLPRPSGGVVPNAVVRKDGGGYLNGGLRSARGEFKVPRPRHEWFPLRRYRFPFMIAYPMTTVLTDYGCPFGCSFCVMQELGFGLRPVADVLAELERLHHDRVREIFFIDQTFGVRQDRTLQLCRTMRERGWSFKWSCFSRADVMTPEVMTEMAAAGCHTIIFGVESGSPETLARYQKHVDLDRIRSSLAACRRAGIRVAATFMFGLPGESEVQARQTLDLALDLPLDYASFNVAIPRAATGLRSESIAQGLITPAVRSMDQSGLDGAMANAELGAARILDLRREAVRRFYLRPGYLLRRLFTLRSWWDLKAQFSDGLDVIKDALGLGA